ncbi:hypothetical protein N7532_005653 [Penicillium argentinense]|uniref:Isopenicillin N synthase-like Fe(2+) 2OG dioxygenase domain-containing protein n=1 Tax=Penicillium argentinense TaxID=1131581 RepID=A0A9W9FED2_9EURO|nr:uncharacterized protein N7532_005653 [Penicillium argentinense]KAJ5098652.1 hypothetical protein N7532_005653 [Penicillium argentinense]
MMRIFALALDVPGTFFDSKIRNPGITSRMMHYPPQPVGERREGLGAHTDFECFTILSQGKAPGLQVLNYGGEWVLAPPIPGTLVVNIADFTYSQDKQKLQVYDPSSSQSIGRGAIFNPILFGIDYYATVSVLENHTSKDNPPCRAPFKAGEDPTDSLQWIREKISKAYVGYEG